MTPELALRNRVADLLRGSAAVTALVGAKIYDDVPSDRDLDDPAFRLPWICMGPIAVRRMQTGGPPSWWVTLRVLAESDAFNRDQAWTIARAAMRAIEGQRGDEDAGFLDPFETGPAGDVIDPGKVKTVFFDVTALLADVD